MGRDGSFLFGYESFIEDSSLEVLTAQIAGYDHDGDGCSALQVADDGDDPQDAANDDDDAQHRCNMDGPDADELPDGTAPLLSVVELGIATAVTVPTFGDAAGQATVKWAVAATGDETDVQQIRAFDTEANTIFVGGDTDGQFVTYDSNDRFNIDRNDPDARRWSGDQSGVCDLLPTGRSRRRCRRLRATG